MTLDYKLLILVIWPIAITVVTQLIKVLIKTVQTGKLEPKEYFAWGKFPSSHIALVSALATVAALVAGIDSLAFGISLALGVIVARDAMGLRMFVEHHSHAINALRSLLPRDKQKLVPKQMDRVGHTPVEAAGGFAFGVGLTLLLYWILTAI
jgi:acid phosphatase family membrane protein YuiD